MKIIAVIALMLAVAGLTACAGATLGNPQGYAGITKADVDVGIAKQGEVPYIKSVTFWDGKEKQSIALTVEFLDGRPKVTYAATGVAAFDGQKVRAEIEKAVSADVKAVAPGIVDSMMNAVTKALLPLP